MSSAVRALMLCFSQFKMPALVTFSTPKKKKVKCFFKMVKKASISAQFTGIFFFVIKNLLFKTKKEKNQKPESSQPIMVFAAMSVFLSFIAALATSDSRSALMCVTVSCIHTEQNTLITWERDLEIKYT